MKAKAFFPIKIIILLMVLFLPEKSFCTHAAGADLTYRWMGGLTYELTVSFYRDCGGVAEPASIDVNYRTLTGIHSQMKTAIAYKDPSSGQEITTTCPGTFTKCAGGTYTGIRQWKYKTMITLPDTASDWLFSYMICCRNCVITTISNPCSNGISNLYVEAMLNNATARDNSSPTFSNFPLAFAYLGQNFNYNHGVHDEDGDSLSFSIVTPKFGPATFVNYISPHNTFNPILSSTPFKVDALTGDLNFTPSTVEVGILALRVQEFRNGKLIGSVMRDMQVYTTISSNTLPRLTGINGTGENSLTVCAGENISFSIYSFDDDSTQNLEITTDSGISEATYAILPGSRPRLDFSWTPGQEDASNMPHVFTVKVKDDACGLNGVQIYSFSILVSRPYYDVTTQNISCKGRKDGSIQLHSHNEYEYLWSNNSQESSLDTLSPGIYIVTVTDAQTGCFQSDTILIVEPPGETFTETITPAICNGQCNGTISIDPLNTNYSYQWSHGASGTSVDSLCRGFYTLTVSSDNNCLFSSTYFVPSADTIYIQATVTDIECPVTQEGAIDITVTGGESPYTFSWNNGASSEDLSSLVAGSYTLTVTDNKGCSEQLHTSVINKSTLELHHETKDETCFGALNGSVIVELTGGSPPYSFLWNTGSMLQSLTNAAKGNYMLTVTESNGCSSHYAFIVNGPETLLELNPVITPLTCHQSSDGTIALNIAGGAPPYSVNWVHGDTAWNVSGLGEGAYAVSVADAAGCVIQDTIYIDAPLPIVVKETITHVQCNGASGGSIALSVEGGTEPYQYEWSDGSSAGALSGLSSGVYQVTISDKNGCSFNASYEVTEPSQALSVSGSANPVRCKGESNGLAEVTVTGGVSPYVFAWSNGSSLQTVNNLEAGLYICTVTDANGCIEKDTVIISEPQATLDATFDISPVKCKNSNTGEVYIHATGGNGGYSYLWGHGSINPTVTGLNAGLYTVTITDQYQCSISRQIVIKEPRRALTADAVISDITCTHPSGTIALNLDGGTPPYDVQWNNGLTGVLISELHAGEFRATISDAAGCTIDTTFILHEKRNFPEFSIWQHPASCLNGLKGSAGINVQGGTAPYTYKWNTGDTSSTVNSLNGGIYTVTLTDAAGCKKYGEIQLTDTSSIRLNTGQAIEICAGTSIELHATTEHEGTWQWYYNTVPLNGTAIPQFTTAAPGSYHAMVTGECGTFSTDTVSITTRSPEVSVSNDMIICAGESARLTAGGGTRYKWLPSEGLDADTVADPLASPLQTTLYTVSVSDESGCKSSADVTVFVLCDTLNIPNGYSPNNDGINDEFVIEGLENYPSNTLFIYNRWGNLIFKERDYANKWNGVSNIKGNWLGKEVPDGTYYYILDLHNEGKPVNGYVIIKR